MPVSTPKYKNLFCQTLKKQVLIRGFLLYSTAFASISSTRNQGSFDSEELEPLKWYRSMRMRKSCFVFAGEEFESKVMQIPGHN